MRVGGCNPGDGPKDKQDVDLFFAGALNTNTGVSDAENKDQSFSRQAVQKNRYRQICI
jgi:hypothetical protein